MSPRLVLALSAGLAASLASGAASAIGGGGNGNSPGDSYINDLQRNPRFIQPGGEQDPSRYRASNPRAGYDDRQIAAGRYRSYGYGYPGRITVRPYGY